jgi:hypothetical protein
MLLAGALAACADAPITPAHLEDDGQLREGLQQSAFRTSDRAPQLQTAQALRLTAVLATQSSGALEDSNRFIADADASVFLHVRADQLEEPRPARFVWSFGELREESIGFLMPSETLSLAASHSLLPEQAGLWKVEVYEVSPFGTDPLLVEREFEVVVEPDE